MVCHLVMIKSCFGHLHSQFVLMRSSAESQVQVRFRSGKDQAMPVVCIKMYIQWYKSKLGIGYGGDVVTRTTGLAGLLFR